jgi:hypothetical protein
MASHEDLGYSTEPRQLRRSAYLLKVTILKKILDFGVRYYVGRPPRGRRHLQHETGKEGK